MVGGITDVNIKAGVHACSKREHKHSEKIAPNADAAGVRGDFLSQEAGMGGIS
jgi:hypothetical protein